MGLQALNLRSAPDTARLCMSMTTKLTKKELSMYNLSYIIAVCRCITYSEYVHYTFNVWMNIHVLQSVEKI